jgi:hypothetical protein
MDHRSRALIRIVDQKRCALLRASNEPMREQTTTDERRTSE